MWVVEISYKGSASKILDKKVEEIALEGGGTWAGQGWNTNFIPARNII